MQPLFGGGYILMPRHCREKIWAKSEHKKHRENKTNKCHPTSRNLATAERAQK